MADIGDPIGVTVLVLTGIAIVSNITSILIKLIKDFSTPKLWKFSWLYEDITCLILCVGLVLFSVYALGKTKSVCDASGYFLLFGIQEVCFSQLTSCIILLSIQNPGKANSLSKLHRNVVIIIITPQIIASTVFSILPYASKDLFNTDVTFDVICLPIRTPGYSGGAYGLFLIILFWIILTVTLICDAISVLKLWKYYNRINSAQYNVWQSQLLSQGKSVIKLSLVEHALLILLFIIITVSIFSDALSVTNNRTWIVMTSLAVSAIIHGVFSNISDVMWATCCCRDTGAVKEPHRKLKKLELLKIEVSMKSKMLKSIKINLSCALGLSTSISFQYLFRICISVFIW